MASLTHQYIPRTETNEENLFIEEYYSSTDTKIYIDDVEQTEIGYINYSLQEQLKPMYGYASQTFDDVAIGNRIVTGTLKIPIKHLETNSSKVDIINKGKKNYNYNDDEEEKAQGVEWINSLNQTDNTSSQSDSNNGDISDDDYEYRTKLMNLGYGIDYNSTPEEVAIAVKKFQSEHQLDITGKFDVSTKAAIDSAINTSNGFITMSVPKNTKLYVKPTHGCDSVTLAAQEVYILDNEFDDGWIYVMTKDGTEGFICTRDF